MGKAPDPTAAVDKLDEARDAAAWAFVMKHLEMVRALYTEDDDYGLIALDYEDLLAELIKADAALRIARAAAMASPNK